VDIFARNRRLTILILILVLMNISLMLMLWFETPKSGTVQTSSTPEDEQVRIEHMLKDKLGFSDEQIDEFMLLRMAHRTRIDSLQRRMQDLKNQIFNGVLQDVPEPVMSDSLLSVAEKTQMEIERLTFGHLLDLKRLCKPEQRERLQQIIHELLARNPKRVTPEREPPATPPDGGHTPPPRERNSTDQLQR
jgi:hypothetical protein